MFPRTGVLENSSPLATALPDAEFVEHHDIVVAATPDRVWDALLATRWAEETNYFPGTTEAVDEVTASGDELTEVFATQMVEGGRPVPVTPAWGKIEGAKTLGTMISSVLDGTAVQDAADTAAEEMDGFFSE